MTNCSNDGGKPNSTGGALSSIVFQYSGKDTVQTVKINGVKYDVNKFSDQTKAQVVSLQFVQPELVRLEAHIAVFKTTEASCAKALRQDLGIG